MTTWEEIRDEVAGMLADGKPLEDVIGKLEKRKNEIAKANLLKAMDEIKKGQMTNEEWLKSMTTEELANYIATQCADAIRLWRDMQYWTAHEKCKSNKWYVWLKEIHHAE